MVRASYGGMDHTPHPPAPQMSSRQFAGRRIADRTSPSGYSGHTGYLAALVRLRMDLDAISRRADLQTAARAELAGRLVDLLMLVEVRLRGRWTMGLVWRVGVRLGRLLG